MQIRGLPKSFQPRNALSPPNNVLVGKRQEGRHLEENSRPKKPRDLAPVTDKSKSRAQQSVQSLRQSLFQQIGSEYRDESSLLKTRTTTVFFNTRYEKREACLSRKHEDNRSVQKAEERRESLLYANRYGYSFSISSKTRTFCRPQTQRTAQSQG